MGFANPILGGGGALVYPSIHSPDFSMGPPIVGWSIDKNGNAFLGNVSISGTFEGTDFIINTAGIFFYSGTPALGNLVLSVSAMSGTDQFGNTYPAGINVVASVQTMPAMSNSWNIGGHAKYILDPVGNLVVSFKDLQPGTIADGTTIWAAGTFPAAYRPHDNRRVVAYSDGIKTVGSNLESPALEFESDGSVQVYGVSSGATRLDCFAVIPLAF